MRYGTCVSSQGMVESIKAAYRNDKLRYAAFYAEKIEKDFMQKKKSEGTGYV